MEQHLDQDPGEHPREDPGADAGGEGVCWLSRVCPACGRLAEDPRALRCPQCAEELPAPG
ncbi:hypothetical protein GTQ99_03085 [Kineococcus sp. T13]|uniref:hypothetical protein n=1 Tax=Kineococcus vitellinus TaxID=2696565 RepID=UPI001411B9EF|nr:hypothetical protein [Kineococcus vitellinus]NAZ74409.1 hypothetical protein [Kineococcus vitellinus]